MTDRQRQTRLSLLVSAHVLLGLILALVALGYPSLKNLNWAVVGYTGLVGTETLLLGMWAGLSGVRSWVKLCGLLAGMAWIECLALATAPRPNADVFMFLLVAVSVPVLTVAASCAMCRRFFAKVECRNHWKPRALSEEMQFTLRSMIGLTVVIAALLALGRLIQWIYPSDDLAMLSFVFALLAMIATGMLVWAALGQGQVIVRFPIVLVGITLLGLLPPYYQGGPSFRFFVWPSLTALVAAGIMGSLFVVRSCGYRLVRIEQAIAQEVSA